MDAHRGVHRRLKDLAVLTIAAMVILPLYTFGLSFPQFRVRGDAYEYLAIAQQFEGFASALSYAGDRAAGMPIFEFVIRRLLGLFASTIDAHLWVDAVCLALLATHIATAWLFSLWARRTNLITSGSGAYVLFLFLGTYPALIGYTTTPLTDTLAIDLVLCAIAAVESAFRLTGAIGAGLLSGAAGLLFGFSILVRPGSLLGIALGLTAGGVLALFRERRKVMVIGIAVLGCAATLAPFVSNCTQKYGTVCLQSPQTVSFVVSAQAGLRGARILWSNEPSVPGELPMLPDEPMFTDYYRRCHLQSIVGVDESSWTGCLLSRPLSIPAYAIKKWIGLFDNFRFTPYLESFTPPWVRWLSRAYDALAWIGLALLFWSLLQVLKRQNRANSGEWLANHITPVLLLVYSMAMLAVHTVLHVEDRYGFPIVPLCAALLVIYGERTIRQYRVSGWRSIWTVAMFSIVAWALFIAQITAWDRAPFF